jgi:hypothetical protein
MWMGVLMYMHICLLQQTLMLLLLDSLWRLANIIVAGGCPCCKPAMPDMRAMLSFLIEAQEPHSEERRAASSVARYSWSSTSSRWEALEQAAAAAAEGAVVPANAGLAYAEVLG